MQPEACKRQIAAPLSSRVKGNFYARFRTRGEQWQHSPRLFYKALAAKTEGWYERQERIDYKQTSSLLTGWKKTEDLDFLNEVSCVPLQQCLRHLQKAFANFWGKRAKYPRFKAKRNGGSAEFTKSAFKFRDGAAHSRSSSSSTTGGHKPSLWLAKSKEPLPQPAKQAVASSDALGA